MDAVSAVVTQPAVAASSGTVSATTTTATTIPTTSNAINVNQSNNHIHSHTNNTHNSGTATTTAATNNGVISNSSNSNSSCSSSSTSSNSSGYGSTTTTPTNNYELQQQQQTTPTTTPIPTTPVAIAEPIIPVATVAAVTPFYNESITSHNLETHQLQHHSLHTQQHQQQQQHQLQQHQHHLLQPNHHQLTQNHLQSNLQQQQQYLSRQQYYSTYDYQQPAPTHNLTAGSTAAPAAYNLGIAGPYDISASSYGSGQYKSSGLTGAINYERAAGVRTNAAANYNSQQQQPSEQQQTKTINQQTQPFPGVLASSKQRTASLIGNSTSTNTSKPQAAATPFYAQPLVPQTHSNPTPFYDNSKYKMPLEYHDSYSNPSAAAATASYHQQQKYYAAAKSQLKEAGYGAPAGLPNSKSVYPNTGNFFPGPAASYDKYMYPHASATGYASSTGHLGNETPPDVGNYRKPVVANSMNSPSWPWGIDYASGNSRTIPPPPPASHLPTATVAPTHATYLTQNPTALSRDPYYMGHDKYSVKYDKYAAASYQQSYVSPPASRHHIWPNTPHGSNLQQLNERHLLASGPTAPPPSHGLHNTPYFPANTNNGLNSRQSCCSQPYQPQSCYYPPAHPMPPRLPHNQSPTVAAPASGYLSSQQPLGQSAHLNALSASCKYGSIIPDYGNGNKLKNSNDLYLNAHHYDNNTSPHNYGYGSAHSSQQLYASNAHQSMAHGLTPSSILTHDPLNANSASYTNDLSLTTSNFDNYHTHLDSHLSPPTLAGIHGQQPPPAYGPTVAKRALLDYRKPIQPQPPPTIAEECYTTLTSRDNYNQQELLNTPETTTTFGEYETHQDNATSLSSYSHATEVIGDADKASDEGNKNLSLRDFIANWNDDEDEYQNNEELSFEQSNVIDEVLQTAPVEQEAAASAVIEKIVVIKTTSLDAKNKAELKESHKLVENPDNSTLNESYVNLPDIVIDIEKSNNVNNSITTPSTTPTPPIQQEENNSSSLNLNNFDVEKELDELKLKKSPQQQEITKDLNDIKETANTITTPQLSPCKNLTTQLSFEDLNLEPTNKTVLASDRSSELTDNYFKDMEGYESGSSRHSNESAFEKEYETFINKITSDTSTTKSTEEKSTEMDFEQNVQDFSKFYKRKRKLKEDELKATDPEAQNQKKLKPNIATKVNNSNFPQVYTKKSRNRLQKTKSQITHKRKPLSLYYKIIHSIRRFGLYRLRRVREYMTELKEKHLPLIKRQSIKNYTHDISENLCNAKSLKALCIMAINTEEFRQTLMLSLAQEEDGSLETEENHICTDPTCETCEVIKSLMEAESFADTLIQQVAENPIENSSILCEEGKSVTILCEEGDSETIKILEDVTYQKDESEMISNAIENIQYSKENPTESDAKDIGQHPVNPADIKSLLYEKSYFETDISNGQYQSNVTKAETEFDLKNWYEKSNSPDQDLQAKGYSEIPVTESATTIPGQDLSDKENVETPLNPVSEKEHSEIPQTTVSESATNSKEETNLTQLDNLNLEGGLRSEQFTNDDKQKEAVDSPLVSTTEICNDENSNSSIPTTNKIELEILTTAECSEISKTNKSPESDTEESDTSESDSESSSSSSDDESVDDSKESYKKSENNGSDSDTDSESDLDDDEIVKSDNDESNQSKHTAMEKRKSNTEAPKPIESENIMLSPNSIKESENVNQTSMKSSPKADSDEEDEVTPKRHQRIVLRIKKSFQPSPNNSDSREIYVSEKSIESSDEFDSHSESESEDDDIVSPTSKLSPKPKDSLKDQTSDKSLPLATELDNATESESDDEEDIAENEFKTGSKPSNLRPKEEDSNMEVVTEKSMVSQKELGNQTESESEDDDVSEKETEDPSNLRQKQEDSIVEVAAQKELGNQTESESEDDDVSEKETETPFTSPKKINFVEDHAFDKSLKPHIESDDQTESEDDEIPEKKSKLMTTSSEFALNQENHTNANDDSENLGDPTESVSEVENILDRKSVIVSTSLNVSPRQDDHGSEEEGKLPTKVDNQVEKETEEDNNDISEKESVLNGDAIKDHNSPKSSELYKESGSNNLENESNIITKTIDMSSIPQNVIDEEKSADLCKNVEIFRENLKLSPMPESSNKVFDKYSEPSAELDNVTENSLKDEDISKNKPDFIETSIESRHKLEAIEEDIISKQKSTQNFEAHDNAGSQSEDETDEEQDFQLKIPNKKLQLKEADDKVILSDSDESSSDSEYESDEEDNLKESLPIVISDDDSIDGSDAKEIRHQPKECISQMSEDSNERFRSDAEESLINNDEISISSQVDSPTMTKQDAKDAEMAENTSENIISVDKISADNEVLNNTIQSDEQLATDINRPNESLPLNAADSKTSEGDEEVSNNSIESAEQFTTNINIPKEHLPLDLVRAKDLDSEITREKCLSEYSSSSEDSDEEIDDTLSTKVEKHAEEEPQMSLGPLQDTEEQSSRSSVKTLNDFEDNKNMNVSLERLETNSPKLNVENEELQEPEVLIKESNISDENRENLDILSTQTNVEEADTAPSNNIPIEICKNLEILADVIVNRITAEHETQKAESEIVLEIGETNESDILEDSDSLTSETSKQNNSIHQLQESEINSKAINEEPTEIIVANSEPNLENVHRETSTTFNSICCDEQSTVTTLTDEALISGTETVDFEKDVSGTLAENSEPLLETFIENSDLSVEVNNSDTSEALNEMSNPEDSNTEDVCKKSPRDANIEAEGLEKVKSKEILDEKSIQMEKSNEGSEVISKPIIEESDSTEVAKVIKENSEINSETETKDSEIISRQIPDIPSPEVINDNENTKIIPEQETKESKIISQPIALDSDNLENSNNQLENCENTLEHANASNEEIISEPDLPETADKDLVALPHVEPLEQISVETETELVKPLSEAIVENSHLEEESSNLTYEVLQVKYEKTNKFSKTWEDTDIFEEINTEGTSDEAGSSDKCDKTKESTDVAVTETIEEGETTSDTDIFKEINAVGTSDETESSDECKTKESATATIAESIEEGETTAEAIIQPIDSLEEDESVEQYKNENTEIVETTFQETNSEEEIEKSNRLSEEETVLECLSKSEIAAETPKPNRQIENENSEYYEEFGPADKYRSEPEAVVENTNKLIEDKNEASESCEGVSNPIHQHLPISEVEKPNSPIENDNKVSECYEDESGSAEEYLEKSKIVVEKTVSLVEDKIETSEIEVKEFDADPKSEIAVLKPNSPVAEVNETVDSNKEETEIISKNKDDLASIGNHIHEELTVEHQVESLHANIEQNESINQAVNNIPEIYNQESGSNLETLPKDPELPKTEDQPNEEPTTEHQTETLERISNDSLRETALNKDTNTHEDLSGDFLGFKNQSSFEDESEDFHGFEDLEEVTRIRQEIENLNDDSTANDGFLNYATLSRELHKASTTSLTGSTSSEIDELEALEKELSQHQPETSSEINELEALEKELSQHQPEIEVPEEEEDKETDRDMKTATNKVVSTNDIEHIKQMLESDEEQLEQEESETKEDDKNQKEDKVQSTTSADTSKDKSKYILSSVNSIIPKLSDLCRAALNSSLNSNSNLAQHTTTETSTILVERELSVEEALAEMYRQAGVLLSDPEDCDNEIHPNGDEEAHDVLLINLQEILNSDNNDVYVLQCDMNENVLNVVQQTGEESRGGGGSEQESQVNNENEVNRHTERVNTVQFIGILDTQSTEPQIHIISSDSESEVIILSDDESDIVGYRPFIARPERITIPFINDDNDIHDSDSLSDISTIHHEEIVPDNLNKFLQEEFYKYLHEKYVQRNISKYYHANRVLKKYKKRYIKTKRQ